jgi:hypothetical protein
MNKATLIVIYRAAAKGKSTDGTTSVVTPVRSVPVIYRRIGVPRCRGSCSRVAVIDRMSVQIMADDCPWARRPFHMGLRHRRCPGHLFRGFVRLGRFWGCLGARRRG